jgi:RNA methyltransferase, TrmH family
MKPISWYKSLSQSQHRREAGYFLIDGKRSVDHILTHYRQSVSELLCVEDTAQSYQSQSSDIPIRIISETHMNTISPSRTPQGVCALVRIPDDVYTSKIPEASTTAVNNKILLLEHVQDPGNVGTLIRTAAAFGVDGVIMSGQCADPFSPKTIQSTAGSILSLWIRRSGNYLQMITELKNRGYKLIAADLNGDELRSQEKCAGPHILALGSEGSGLSDDVIGMSDCKIRIPIAESGAESLNVAVAGGILMFVWG